MVHDNGSEFQNHDFQFNLDCAGIDAKNISPCAPTANAICEASHKAIGQVIRTLIKLKPPTTATEAENPIDEALASAMHALRCNPITTLGNHSPGALVFNGDVFLNIPLVADILTLTQNRHALIDKRLIAANSRQTRHEFKVNDLVFQNIPSKNKLDPIRDGPFPIIQVHTNNTCTIQKPNTTPIRLNIRQLTPHKPA